MALLAFSLQANAAVTAYNTFLPNPQRFGQQSGFGYSGGLQVTDTIFGVSFIPTISGNLVDIWIALGTSLADPGDDLVNVFLATSGSQKEPDLILAETTVNGELAKRESVVEISAGDTDIFLQAGTLYWMLISPGPGTPQVGWLGGPPNEPEGTFSAYLDPNSPTGWFIAPFNSNGAMRIDVSPVPEPETYAMLSIGLLLVVSSHRAKKHP
ncbi:MAG: hypothetical protein B7Y41_09250 [Hydrogenophilales bacterium 28-61-23]|nr:MAG: hypothetical protein B7Y41_09250 [Hydrogenophilales bacterium 28-61-23]